MVPRTIRSLLVWLLWSLFAISPGCLSEQPPTIGAEPCVIVAASANQVDVQAAVNVAKAGNVICVPAGAVTWSTPVTINNGPNNLHIYGAGESLTVISVNQFSITGSTTGTLIRGFTFTAVANPIDPGRRIDWTNAGVRGGIPSGTWAQCVNANCATVTTAGCAATLAQVNAAIASAPTTTYVLLPGTPGSPCTFNFGGNLLFSGVSNVALRGGGPDGTKILATAVVGQTCNFDGLVCFTDGSNGPNVNLPAHLVNLSGTFTKGSTQLTFANTTGLAVGDLVMMDQLDDSDVDTGTVWVCSTWYTCSTEGNSGIRRSVTEDNAPTTHASGGRSQVQVVTVTACTPACGGAGSTTVTFTPGLFMPQWSATKTPQAWWSASHSIANDGLENLTLDYSAANGTNLYMGVQINGGRDIWVKNVRSIYATTNQVGTQGRSHINPYAAGRVTIRDSYFWGTKNAATQSYGIETDLCSDILIENNIFQHVVTGFIGGEAATDVVFAYNFAIDDFYPNGTTYFNWMQGSEDTHNAGMSFHLYEANDGLGFIGDAIHGPAHFSTIYRDHLTGYDPYGGSVSGKSQQTIAVHVYALSREMNIVGAVLGRTGTHTVYEGFPALNTTCGPDAGADRSIYMLGYDGNEQRFDNGTNCPGFTDPGVGLNDTLVRGTLFRWGNYDIVTAAVRFCIDATAPCTGSEVPSGLANYPNPVPASHALPNSQYYTTKPSFLNKESIPWPICGPDVTTGTLADTGSHCFKNAARVCQEGLTVDSVYTGAITAVSVANPTQITTSSVHGLGTGTSTTIAGTSVTTSPAGGINNTYTVTVIDSTHYTIPVNVTGVSVGTGTFTLGLKVFNATSCY